MALPEAVAIKFDIYTLACRELLNRLQDLHAATQTNTRLDYELSLQRFDEVLHEFFQRATATSKTRAAEQFGNLLGAQVDLFRDSNAIAAEVFDDVVSATQANAPSWHHQDDLEEFHHQGRELARQFFAESGSVEIQERLDCECHLVIKYGAPADDDRVAMLAEPFGYRAAPMAYYSSYWRDEEEGELVDVVLTRFNFDHDFTLYLAYPFLFLHEYTAHVYAMDHGNERFNDGWMLHAAAAFLKREWNRSPEQFELNWEQVGVFYERLYGEINRIPRRACRFALMLDDWLYSMRLPNRFMFITHELAVFQPESEQDFYWPNRFIYALEYEFMNNRDALLGKIQASTNVRDLMTMLSAT